MSTQDAAANWQAEQLRRAHASARLYAHALNRLAGAVLALDFGAPLPPHVRRMALQCQELLRRFRPDDLGVSDGPV